MPRQSALRSSSPPENLRRAEEQGQARRALSVLGELAKRACSGKVAIENLRQLTNDGHPGFDTGVRVFVVRPQSGFLEKREKGPRAADHRQALVKQPGMTQVPRVELANESTTGSGRSA
jgi:hypothetical protein